MSISLPTPEDSLKTLSGHVQERIREAILTRVLQPGDRVDQNQMAEQLQVSVAPVREALRGLEAEGLVRIIPRRGAFVTSLSLADLNTLYFARSLLEGETIYHAVPHLAPPNLDKSAWLLTQMEVATATHDVSTFIRLNREFHLCLYTALANEHLLQMIRQLWERSELYRYQYMFMTPDTQRIHAEHRAILDACQRRDQAEARAAAVQHIEGTRQALNRFLVDEVE